jgi:adenylate kinase
LFRAHLAEVTPLGIAAGMFMDSGNYVPDRITNAMVRDRLSQPDAADGFLLDGYPRTLDQVGVLDGALADMGLHLDRVVELTVDTDEIVARLLKRAQEQGRADDTEDVIRRRMEVYTEQTEPLTRVYAEAGILVQVDGMGTVDEVRDRVLAVL